MNLCEVELSDLLNEVDSKRMKLVTYLPVLTWNFEFIPKRLHVFI